MYVRKNLLNLDCKDSIRFGICKIKGHFGSVSPSRFLHNVLIETSCVCFKNFTISYRVLCHFFNMMNFRVFKTHTEEEYVI